jgi:hypothetical protein
MRFPGVKQTPRLTDGRRALRLFSIETPVYAIFVTLYFFAALKWWGHWLLGLYQNQRTLYATVALAMIVGQGIILELLTSWLMGWLSRRTK